MQPSPNIHVVSNIQDEFTGPIAPTVTGKHNESEEFHNRYDIGLLSLFS